MCRRLKANLGVYTNGKLGLLPEKEGRRQTRQAARPGSPVEELSYVHDRFASTEQRAEYGPARRCRTRAHVGRWGVYFEWRGYSRANADAGQTRAIVDTVDRLFTSLIDAEAGQRGFFAGYCLVMGYLIFRSGYLPRALGVLLQMAGKLCEDQVQLHVQATCGPSRLRIFPDYGRIAGRSERHLSEGASQQSSSGKSLGRVSR